MSDTCQIPIGSFKKISQFRQFGVKTDEFSVENNLNRIFLETTILFQSKAPIWARFGTPRNFAMYDQK